MDTKQIKQYLEELNDELQAMNIKGEVCLYGGAVMCLVYDARPATKDVGAVFKPTSEMRQAISRKAISARAESYDPEDVKLLIGLLGLKKPGEVFDVIEKYYPREQIKPVTQYFIEELFEQ